MSEVSRLGGFSIRSSGRDLNAVRRPVRDLPKGGAKPKVEKASAGPDAKPLPNTRPRPPEKNDATVKPDVPRG